MKPLLLVLFLLLPGPLLAQQDRKPAPYELSEFPEWAHDIRRFEVVLFGTFPITMLLSSLVLDLISNAMQGKGALDPQPVNSETIGRKLAISISLSGVLAITDLIINRSQISQQQQKREELLRELEKNGRGE